MNCSIYGIDFATNIDIHFVNRSKIEPQVNLNVSYTYTDKEISPISVKGSQRLIEVELSPFAQYQIRPNDAQILCQANNYEAFFSTFFNIPLSAYILSRNELLLHVSSILIGNKLIGLAGEKGIGKSTLTNLLCGDDDLFRQYSDDTLRIDEHIIGYKGHNLSKLKDDTVLNLGINKVAGFRNAVGKQYVELDTDYEPHALGAIVLIQRKHIKRSSIVKIASDMVQQKTIFENIVGINYLCPYLIKQALGLAKKIHIPVYILNVPDTLPRLINEKERIKCLLCELK